MRHRKSGRKFGRKSDHRKALFSNLVASLVRHGRIETTEAKAKELRSIADRTINWGVSVCELTVKEPGQLSMDERAKIVHAKRMARRVSEIAIQFKEVPHLMFRRTLGESIAANRLTLGLYPEEEITLTFQTKHPGAEVRLRSVTMDFYYHQNHKGPVLDAYEKVLIDCMLGDQMLFWRQDGVELCWSFLTPVLEECETCGFRAQMLSTYESGSWGPEAALKFMQNIQP